MVEQIEEEDYEQYWARVYTYKRHWDYTVVKLRLKDKIIGLLKWSFFT